LTATQRAYTFGAVKNEIPGMHIRPATPDDAPRIAHVQVEGWRTTYRGIVADEFLDRMSVEEAAARWLDALGQAKTFIWVAQADDGPVVAFAAGGPERSGRGDYPGELYAIYILLEWRGGGIGAKLVRRSARRLFESGTRAMLVWVLADNPSRRFYEALGGRLIGQQPLAIGEQELIEVAYGWTDLEALAGTCDE